MPNPEDRYASCRALADDVERWAADEPVTAWGERTRIAGHIDAHRETCPNDLT